MRVSPFIISFPLFGGKLSLFFLIPLFFLFCGKNYWRTPSSMEGGVSDLRSFLPKWKKISPDRLRFKKNGPKVIFPIRKSAGTRDHPGTTTIDLGGCDKATALRTAETALSSYNQSNKEGLQYELVDAAVNCICCCRTALFHCNFIAKPKTTSDEAAEEKLFFAEVKFVHHIDKDPKKPDGFEPRFCCIIGSTATKTGENGCMSCERQPGVIQHPEDGFINVMSKEHFDHFFSRKDGSHIAETGQNGCKSCEKQAS